MVEYNQVMKIVSTDILEESRKYLKNNCRKLEVVRFEYLFNNGDLEKVLEELKGFQNSDGGFGNGLEPDSTHPQSSVLASTIALQIISEGNIVDSVMVGNLVEYLENSYVAERKGWLAMTEDVNNYPHAIWWNWDNNKKQTSIDEHWGNPTAEVVGYLYKYRQFLRSLDINELLENTICYWEKLDDFKSEHEVYCYIRLHKLLPVELAKRLESNLINATRKLVVTDSDLWKTYNPQPVSFADNPSYFLYDVVNGGIEKNLDFLMETITDNGVWFPNWNWYQYESDWEKSKMYWVGVLTIQNLKILRAYKRIKAGEMWNVYVLRSLVNGKFYTGYTGDFDKRLKAHNSGRGGRFTKLNKPFELVYKEDFEDKYTAQKRERELKTNKGRYWVKKIVNSKPVGS